jgi:hypothetical protein
VSVFLDGVMLMLGSFMLTDVSVYLIRKGIEVGTCVWRKGVDVDVDACVGVMSCTLVHFMCCQ